MITCSLAPQDAEYTALYDFISRLLLQAEQLEVLLSAPGIKPSPICLFRQGDVDWLSHYQLHKLLGSNLSMTAIAYRARRGKRICFT